MKISGRGWRAGCLAFLLSGLAAGLPSSALAQGTAGAAREGVARETPAPAATDLSPAPAAPKFDVLQRLEEQLNQAFKRFSKKNDSAGPGNEIPLRRQSPVVTSQSNGKAQDTLDRKKNWGFMNLEEMMGLPPREEAMDGMNPGRDKKSKGSLIERYYENLGKKSSGLDSSLKSTDRSFGNSDQTKEDDSLPPRLRETQNNLRKLLNSDGSGRFFESTPERGSMSDIFGLGNGGMSVANQEIAHRAYMDQYRDVLGISAPGTDAGKLLDPLSSAGAKTPLSAGSPLGVTGPTAGSGGGLGQLGAINPVLTPRGPEDVNTRPLNQWNPMYTPPRIESKPTPVQRPTWEAPRRKF